MRSFIDTEHRGAMHLSPLFRLWLWH